MTCHLLINKNNKPESNLKRLVVCGGCIYWRKSKQYKDFGGCASQEHQGQLINKGGFLSAFLFMDTHKCAYGKST